MSEYKDMMIMIEDLQSHVDLLQDLLASANKANSRLSAENARLSIAYRELIMDIDATTSVAMQELDYLKHPHED